MDTKQLRQKILDLAIHGKLVPQDPNDEPASVLLERIRVEKERLIKEGKIKRGKKSAKTSDTPHYEQVPFEVPQGWVWCRLEDIAHVASGSTPSKECFVSKGIPYIKMYNLRNQKIDFDYQPQYITEEVHNGKLARSRTETGDLLMNIVGPPLGKLAIIPTNLPQANFNQAAVLIRPYAEKETLVSYLKAYLEEMSEINSIATRGSAGQVNISLTQSQNMRIPLPPLNEQKRLLVELNRWMDCVSMIEDGKDELANTINQTKSKILDLAIHGKLVPQDPADEPAIKLLRRINPKFTPCDNGQYGQIPKTWLSVPLEALFDVNPKSKLEDKMEVGFVPMELVADGYSGTHSFESRKWAEVKKGYCHFANSDIGVAKISPCFENLKSTLFDNLPNGHGAGTTELVIMRNKGIHPKFYLYLFKSNWYIAQGTKYFKGVVGQQRVNREIFTTLHVPLPPLEEQQRIVARIEELFATLDKMQNSLEA